MHRNDIRRRFFYEYISLEKLAVSKGTYCLSVYTAYVVYSFVILLTQGLWIVNNSIQPTLIKYGEVETKKMATAIMTKAVKDRINEGFDVDSLMKVQNDKNGKVSTINLNTKQVNEIVTSTTTYIENICSK